MEKIAEESVMQTG